MDQSKEQLEIELERCKLTNYILEEENNILKGNIAILTEEKKAWMKYQKTFKRIQNSVVYRGLRKIKNKIKK